MVREEEEGAHDFLLELAVENTQVQNPEAVNLCDVLSRQGHVVERFNILKDLSLLSSLVKGLDDYLGNGAKQPLRLSNADFCEFLL